MYLSVCIYACVNVGSIHVGVGAGVRRGMRGGVGLQLKVSQGEV